MMMSMMSHGGPLLCLLLAYIYIIGSIALSDRRYVAFIASRSTRKAASCRNSKRSTRLVSYVAGNSQDLEGTNAIERLPDAKSLEHDHLKQEAEAMLRRARELKAEASELELSIKDSRSADVRVKNTESDSMIDHLFSGNVTTIELASRLDRERWSPDQLTIIMERLHERQVLASGTGSVSRRPSEGFQLADARNSAEQDTVEVGRLERLLGMLVEAAGSLDEKYSKGTIQNARWTGRVAVSLSSRLKELRRTEEENFKRRLAVSVNIASSTGNSSAALEEYMRTSLGLSAEGQSSNTFNISRVIDQVALVPMWVPSSILPFLLVGRAQLDSADVKRIKEEVLVGTQFYCTSSESIPAAAIFRGNVRTPAGLVNTTMERNHSAVVFEEIQNKLNRAGISERVQLFFWSDPEWRPGRDQRETSPPPVIIALPKAIVPEQVKERALSSRIVAGASILLTIAGTLAYSLSCFALNPTFFHSIINQKDISIAAVCLPIFVGVLLVQVAHESAHRFMARRLGIKIGRPLPLPSSQIGTFGSITPLRSFPSNRAALLDFALSGPVAGMGLSILLLIGGVFATVYASSGALSNFPVVPAAILKSSFFVGSLLTMLVPKTMLLPLSQPIPIHPSFMVGFAGLISNALNMLPIGRLDGGRAYSAVFGSRNAVVASLCTLGLLSLLALTGMSTIAIFFGLLVITFQRQPEIPLRDEVTEVDDVRVGVYTASLALALLALAPFPGGQGML